MKLTQTAAAARKIVRAKTRDVAFQFRMGTGFPGDVNRFHPASIEPNQNNATNPLDVYGNAVVVNSADNTVRKILTSDSAITTIYGIGVRPYPTQTMTGGPNAAFGVGSVNVNQPLDVLRSGYFFSKVNTSGGTPAKDGTVYLWVAASTGTHVLGGFEAAASGGNTVALTNVFFNGPTGSDGVGELFIRTR